MLFNRQFPAELTKTHNITVDWVLLGYAPSLQVARLTCRGSVLGIRQHCGNYL